MANPETLIQNNIRSKLEKNGIVVFRTNVGKVRMTDGRWFDTGLPAGHPDLYGFRPSDNQVFYIEVKTKAGKPRKDQVFFHKVLSKYHVIHGIARSSEEALLIVTNGLIGFGFEKYEEMI